MKRPCHKKVGMRKAVWRGASKCIVHRTLSTCLVVLSGIAFSSALYAESGYMFELNIDGVQSSSGGAGSEDAYDIEFKTLFDFGSKVSAKYGILAEQEFLTRQSSVSFSYSDSSRDVKDTSRSASDIRGLYSAIDDIDFSLLNTDLQALTGQVARDIQTLDLGAIATALDDPDGIPGITAQDVGDSLTTIVDGLAQADASLEKTSVSDMVESDSFGLETRLILADDYILDLGFRQVNTDEFVQQYDVATGAAIDIVGVNLVNEVVIAGFDPDPNVPQFDLTPDLAVQNVAGSQSFDIGVDHDIFSAGFGMYIGETSMIGLTYENSETDNKVVDFERDYESFGVQGKFVTRVPESKRVVVGQFSADRQSIRRTNAYRSNIKSNVDYYFNDYFSVGGGLTLQVGRDLDEANIYQLNSRYFISDNFAVQTRFVFIDYAAVDEDTMPANVESFSIGVTGRY